ncbi:MAG: dockerin type I repeat-containing protein [Oscillospiraceae bacterium]|nr:dockerin type I repeat-containing protein [Oscillospiraceae bacterium]
MNAKMKKLTAALLCAAMLALSFIMPSWAAGGPKKTNTIYLKDGGPFEIAVKYESWEIEIPKVTNYNGKEYMCGITDARLSDGRIYYNLLLYDEALLGLDFLDILGNHNDDFNFDIDTIELTYNMDLYGKDNTPVETVYADENPAAFVNGYCVNSEIIDGDVKYGVKTKEKQVVDFKYDYIADFSDGCFLAMLRDHQNGFGNYGYFYIDENGKEQNLLPFHYTIAESFHEGFAVVSGKNGYVLINKQGEIVTDEGFERLSNISEGHAFFEKDEKFGLIDKSGKIVLPAKYDFSHIIQGGIAVFSNYPDSLLLDELNEFDKMTYYELFLIAKNCKGDFYLYDIKTGKTRRLNGLSTFSGIASYFSPAGLTTGTIVKYNESLKKSDFEGLTTKEFAELPLVEDVKSFFIHKSGKKAELPKKMTENVFPGSDDIFLFLMDEMTLTVIKVLEIKNNLSDGYDIDFTANHISGIPENTSLQNFLNGFKKDVKIEAFDKDNKPITDPKTVIGTGITVKASIDGKGESFTTIVRGDTSGSGVIDASDARAVLRHVAKLDKLEGAYLEAADLDGGGELSAASARMILRHAAGLEKIEQ